MRKWFNQWWCGVWYGHFDIFRVERSRLFLECRECGRETHGWVTHAFPLPPRDQYRGGR